MTSRLLALTLACLAAGCAPAVAAAPTVAPRTVLVELFTSQGCSSCPAADDFLRDLPTLGLPRARVVALAFHVDYWDDLGWKDPFSSPAFTARQRRYVETGQVRGPGGEDGLSGLYTPQMIVDGAVHFSGRRREIALAEIRRAAEAPPAMDLTASSVIDGDRAIVTLRVKARSASAATDAWQAFVAVTVRQTRTSVPRGENGGRTLEGAAVVRSLSAPAAVSLRPDAAAVVVTVTRPRDLPWSALELAAFVQSPKTLRIAAAQAL